MQFYAEKDLALCGLACVLCSQEDCPGCKARGCAAESNCSVYNCAVGKGLDGCYACEQFPCEEKMLQGTRNRAFNRYAAKYGKHALLARLKTNQHNGISYHKPDGITGDYDILATEEEIIRLLRFGGSDPYLHCSVLDTEHFILRLVSREDSADLLTCYTDPQTREMLKADKLVSNASIYNLDDMHACICFFLDRYEKRDFIRLSVIEKTTSQAVGTVEMFDAGGGLGILRLDIASAYEKQTALKELLSLCTEEFCIIFNVNRIAIQSIPAAHERGAVLLALGYEPFDWPEPGREHYYRRLITS